MDKLDKSMNVTLLKREKKESLAHDSSPSWKDVALDAIFGVVEISLDDKNNAKITPVDLEGSMSNSKIAGMDNAEAAAGSEEIDDDFAVVDDDIWQRLVHPWTLQFLSPKREEIYFRSNLLPIRILITRLYSAVLIILLSINANIIQTSTFASVIWITSIVLAFIIALLSWVEKGKYYVDLCLESKGSRLALFSLEVNSTINQIDDIDCSYSIV
jgi:hypothetical protein